MNTLAFVSIFISIIFLESCILGDANKNLRSFIIRITISFFLAFNIILNIEIYSLPILITLIILEVIYTIAISVIYIYIHTKEKRW